jgi:spore germination cell wall hydrolase CwlJ-like protein
VRIYYEAGSQDDDGERAVAQVVLNRVRHPAFPASICGVV